MHRSRIDHILPDVAGHIGTRLERLTSTRGFSRRAPHCARGLALSTVLGAMHTAVNRRLLTPYYHHLLLTTTKYLQLTNRYSLLTTHYSLLTTYSVPLAVCCLRLTAHDLLITHHYSRTLLTTYLLTTYYSLSSYLPAVGSATFATAPHSPSGLVERYAG